jgi:cytochrome b6-f complex iron-sulfur subunit
MSKQQLEETVTRGEFIRKLGMSSAALMSFYCIGMLSACSSKKEDAVISSAAFTGNANTANGTIDFTINLANPDFKKLKTAGGFVNVGDIIVFNAAGNYKALSRFCTHQNGPLTYQSASNDLICSLHGGLFTEDGVVKKTPPKTDLKAYTTSLIGDKLLVKA